MSKFEKKFTLQQNEYLSSIISQMDISTGTTCIVASVGSGKTTDFVNKPDVLIAVPLISIKQSEIDKGAMNIFTWQAVVLSINGTVYKSEFKNKTLVVDESHGLYMDFIYKPGAIRDLINVFKYFKAVVIMSGTLDPNHISSFPITRSYSVYKPQRAEKILNTYVYDKNGMAALESFIHARKGRKTIALINNKGDCRQFAERYGEKALIVNADEKENDDVLELYATRKMGDRWDIILGTNSIREGLSIEDDLDEVDVLIFGHTDPDVIEQFANRFRNVTGVKNVHYFIPKSEVREIADFDLDTYTEGVKVFAQLVNSTYNMDNINRNYKEHFITSYSIEANGSHLRYHKDTDSFEVDLISIDAAYYEHRKKQVIYDPVLFESKMMDYDYSINTTRSISGDSDIAEVLKEGKRVMKETYLEERKERLSTITESFSTGSFPYAGDKEYDYIIESINKLLNKGLKREQIHIVVDGMIDDPEFIRRRVWPDFNYVDVHSNIRNQFLYYISKECPNDELDMFDSIILANMAISTTLNEFFNDNQSEMKKNQEWKKLVEWRGGQLVAKDGYEVKIINRYITLGKRKDKRLNDKTNTNLKSYLEFKGKDRYKVYPVKFTNLTGLDIDRSEAVAEVEAKTEQKISVLQQRLLALRAAA